MPWPSTLGAFTNPNPTQKLNSPSHSSIESAQNNSIGEIQAYLGVTGPSSIVGTLLWQIQSPDSNGGGHVQTTNKGGTGQTSYTKGDLLVATSTSVLSKLSASSVTGQVLTIDPNEATGVKWAQATGANKISLSNSSVQLTGGASSSLGVVFAASVTGSVLGTNSAVRFKGTIRNLKMDSGGGAAGSIMVVVQYGSNIVASVAATGGTASVVGASGIIEGMITGYGSSSLQSGWVLFDAGNKGFPSNQIKGFGYGFSSVESNTTQDLVVKVGQSSSYPGTSILTGLFVLEKIV